MERVEYCLRNGDPEFAGFCLQQAVEKLLKAYLLSRGWNLRRIHDLEALLDDAVAFDASLEAFRTPCAEITEYYLYERYPRVGGAALTDQRIRDSRDAIQGLIDRLRENTR